MFKWFKRNKLLEETNAALSREVERHRNEKWELAQEVARLKAQLERERKVARGARPVDPQVPRIATAMPAKLKPAPKPTVVQETVRIIESPAPAPSYSSSSSSGDLMTGIVLGAVLNEVLSSDSSSSSSSSSSDSSSSSYDSGGGGDFGGGGASSSWD